MSTQETAKHDEKKDEKKDEKTEKKEQDTFKDAKAAENVKEFHGQPVHPEVLLPSQNAPGGFIKKEQQADGTVKLV